MSVLSVSLTQGLPSIRWGWRWLPSWPAIRVPRVITRTLTGGACWRGAPSVASIRWPPAAYTWSCTSAGCRRCAGSSPQQCRGDSRSPRGSTAPQW